VEGLSAMLNNNENNNNSVKWSDLIALLTLLTTFGGVMITFTAVIVSILLG
jgi:hypothetical protein